MDLKKIDDSVSVTGQITARDLPQVRALGFRSVVSVRPDGEAEDQPLYAELQRVAKSADLDMHYLPVEKTGATEQNARDLAGMYPALPKPVLIYCGTGMRAAGVIAKMRALSEE